MHSATRDLPRVQATSAARRRPGALHARRLRDRSEGLVYLDAPDDGDGRVTLQSALLPGVRTWKLDCEHGSLPDDEDAFEAYLELLDERHDRIC